MHGAVRLWLAARLPFYGWLIAVLCIVAKVLKCQGQNNFMTYTVPHLLEDFRLSHGELGTIFSAATVIASFVQPLLGRCVDRFGGKICVPLSLLALSLTLSCFSVVVRQENVVLTYAELATLFFFLRMLSVGACEVFPNACLAKWFVRRRGRAQSVVLLMTHLGHALLSPVVSGCVDGQGWQFALRVGAAANLACLLPMWFLLWNTPEDRGLLPDNQSPVLDKQFDETAAINDTAMAGTANAAAQDLGAIKEGPLKLQGARGVDKQQSTAADAAGSASATLPPGLWPIYGFSLSYGVIFGGLDFSMVDMIGEAGGAEGGVDVALHVFAPLAIVVAVSAPVIGEVVDQCRHSKTVTSVLLGICGLLTCVTTACLSYTNTPFRAVLYSCVRGITGGIFMVMCTTGLAFASFGVERDIIGRALGTNTFATVAGTGLGPLFYGLYFDAFGSFRGALLITSLPPLIFGTILVVRACPQGMLACGARRYGGLGDEPSSQRQQESVSPSHRPKAVRPRLLTEGPNLNVPDDLKDVYVEQLEGNCSGAEKEVVEENGAAFKAKHGGGGSDKRSYGILSKEKYQQVDVEVGDERVDV